MMVSVSTRDEIRCYLHRTRRSHCNQCERCLRDDCDVCTGCKDKREFGSKGVRGKCCIQKQCRNLQDRRTVNIMKTKRKWMPKSRFMPVVFLRDICDEKLLSMFRKNSADTETEDTKTASKKAPNDGILTSLNLGWSQRKRKSNIDYLNSEYPPPAKSQRKDCSITSDPLEGVDINKLIAYLETQNEKDREFLQTEKRKRLEKYKEIHCLLPQTKQKQKKTKKQSKTKKEKLHPYGHLKSLPPHLESHAAFSAFKCESSLCPPHLKTHDNTSSNDAVYTKDSISDPPHLDPYRNNKVKVSFSGRCCKPNGAYYNEFYTDLDKVLPILNRKPKQKKELKEKEDKQQSKIGVEKGTTPINKDREITSITGSHPTLKRHFDRLEIESEVTKSDKTAILMDNNTENAEEDKDTEHLENTVYQDKIRETGTEQAKEDKSEKFFQLDIGDKFIFIPTNGSAEIPKAYVMDKPMKASETYPNSAMEESPVFSSVNPAGMKDNAVVTSESMSDSNDYSLPKITSVFSLSSDGISTKNDSDESQTLSNTTGQDENMERDTVKAPIENSASEKLNILINPEACLKTPETESLFRTTASKTLDNPAQMTGNTQEAEDSKVSRKAETASTGDSHDKYPESLDPSTFCQKSKVCQKSSSESRSSFLTMSLTNLGKLERLVKSTGKVLNQSNVFTQPPSKASRVKIAPEVKQCVPPSSTQKLLLIPKLSSPNSEGKSTLFVTSTQDNKLQNLLPNSKLRFVVDKPQMLSPSINLKGGNPGIRTSGIAVIPKNPLKPVILFPNKTKATFRPILPRQAAFTVHRSNITKPAPSIISTTLSSTRISQDNVTVTSQVGPVPTASKIGFLSTSGVISAVTESSESSEQSTLISCSSAPVDKKPNAIKMQSRPEDNHPSAVKKDISFGQEWVTVKSKPGDKHEFEAAILTDIVTERNDVEINSHTKTPPARERSIPNTRRRDRKEILEQDFTHVHAEETDTEERIRRLREKLRNQQEECESLKMTLTSDNVHKKCSIIILAFSTFNTPINLIFSYVIFWLLPTLFRFSRTTFIKEMNDENSLQTDRQILEKSAIERMACVSDVLATIYFAEMLSIMID